MSGICGWLGDACEPGANAVLADVMAAPLCLFDGTSAQSLSGRRCAVAVAAARAVALLHEQDGLRLAVWGQIALRDPVLAAQALVTGLGPLLAQLWRRGPDDFCRALAGAYALCVIDEAAGEALLAVDRMGSLPMSWQLAGETLVFASSADALRRHPATPARIDAQGIYNYVYFHMVPSDGAIWRDQHRLEPGHFLHYRQGRVNVQRYWRIDFREEGGASFADLREQFHSLLRSSVRSAAGIDVSNGDKGDKGDKGGQGGRRDIRVGAFLSGGTDSSTIAGILGEVSGRPARTYSIGFDAAGYDESAYAQTAAAHFKTAHHAYYVTPDDVVAAIPKIAAIFDQPFGNASAVPAYYCARLAREDGIDRLLGGDGGDELFGGNERYARQSVFARYGKVPRLMRSALRPAIAHFPGREKIPLLHKAHSYIEQASLGMPARLETYNLLERYGPAEVFTQDFLAGVDVGAPLAGLSATYDQCSAGSLVNRMMALDMKITLADNDLLKVVKSCELAGMQVAFPFLNDAMVAFSAGLTPRQKLNGSELRYFFKEALRGFLPEAILRKEKHGFGLPFGVWMQEHAGLRELAADSLASLKTRGIIRPAFIDQLLGRHVLEHAAYHGTMVWVLMMLEQWFRLHVDRRY